MTENGSLWRQRTILAVILALSLVALALLAASLVGPTQYGGLRGTGAANAVVYGALGYLIATRRPRLPVGWLLLAASLIFAVHAVITGYALRSVLVDPSLPGAVVAQWLSAWLWELALIPLVAAAFTFPDGSMPSDRWWMVLRVVLVMLLASVAIFAVTPGREPVTRIANPFAIESLLWLEWAARVAFFVGVCFAFAGVVERYRNGTDFVRRQIKLIAIVLSAIVPVVLAWDLNPDNAALTVVAQLCTLVLVPTALGFALLRYQLFGIDLLVDRTLAYAIEGTGARWVNLAWLDATHREQAAARAALPGLGSLQMRFVGDVDPALRRMLAADRAVLAPFAEVARGTVHRGWLRVASLILGLRWTYLVPLHVSESFAGLMAFHFDDRPDNDRLRTADAFAAHAALTLENGQLSSALRAQADQLARSRERIGEAEESTRREVAQVLRGRVETRLIVATSRLLECRDLIGRDAARAAALLNEVAAELDQIRDDDVRGASHRLHPTVVAIGLVPALRTLSETFGDLEVSVTATPSVVALDDIARNALPHALRLVAYRFVEEAVASLARNAAGAVRVDLAVEEDEIAWLRVAISVEGPRATALDDVLHALRDRVERASGTLAVGREPEFSARLPIHAPMRVAPWAGEDAIRERIVANAIAATGATTASFLNTHWPDAAAAGWAHSVPLRADGGLVGVIRFKFSERPAASTLAVADAFAKQAALTLANTRLSRELRDRAEELAASRGRIADAEELARREIAERLHGQVQSRLLVVTHRLLEARPLIAADPERAREVLTALAADLDRVRDTDLRQAVLELHPSAIGVGLLPALRELAEQLDPRLDVTVEASNAVVDLDDPGRGRLPEAVRLGIYRSVEEALANVARHANAREATVRLDLDAAGSLRAMVTDAGSGHDVNAKRDGVGMRSMRDRAERLGGTLAVRSAPGAGTTVTVTLPVGQAP